MAACTQVFRTESQVLKSYTGLDVPAKADTFIFFTVLLLVVACVALIPAEIITTKATVDRQRVNMC